MQVSKIHIFLPLGKAFLLKELSQMASPSFIILLAFTFNSFLKIPLYIMNRKFDLSHYSAPVVDVFLYSNEKRSLWRKAGVILFGAPELIRSA